MHCNKLFFLAAISLSAFHVSAQTERITFQAPDLYPEGVAYSEKTNQFFVSSVKTGTIGMVDQAGSYKVFYEDKSLKSTFGMKVDAAKNRLWVCVGDPNFSKYSDSSTFKKMARIVILDLATGKKISDIDLTSLQKGKHFANDLALDGKGNAYITDSFSPAIYKIDAAGKASLFTTSELFSSIYVGLNGIVYHPQGFLLVAHNANGLLYKVPLKEPSKISQVKITAFFPGADGLILDKDNNLIVVQNKGVNKAFRLSSTDGWASASVNAATMAEDLFQNPTTTTWQKDKLYALNAKINELSDSTKTPSKEFSLQVVKLRPVR